MMAGNARNHLWQLLLNLALDMVMRLLPTLGCYFCLDDFQIEICACIVSAVLPSVSWMEDGGRVQCKVAQITMLLASRSKRYSTFHKVV